MSEFAGEDQLEGAMAVARMLPAPYIVYPSFVRSAQKPGDAKKVITQFAKA